MAVQVIFGLWPVAGVAVMGHLSPGALIGLRTLIAAPLLFLLFRPRWPDRALWGHLAVLGVLGVGANQLLFTEGLARCGPINASLLTLLTPVQALLMAHVAGHERPSRGRLIGVAVAMVGAIALMRPERLFDASGGMSHTSGGDSVWLGNLLGLGSGTCYAAYLVFGRPVAQRLGAPVMVTWAFAFGALGALPITAPALAAADFTNLPLWAVGSLVFIVLGATVGTYALNAYALAHAESSLVAAYIYLQPLVSGTAAALFLHQVFDARSLVSGVVIALGVLLATRRPPALPLPVPRSALP